MSRRVSLAAVWLAVAVPPVLAQGSNPADMTVDAATRRQVIDGVLARLTEAYVFPDTAWRWSAPSGTGCGAESTSGSQAPRRWPTRSRRTSRQIGRAHV